MRRQPCCQNGAKKNQVVKSIRLAPAQRTKESQIR